jgi:F0F1-type ATP synthase assembly protein I
MKETAPYMTLGIQLALSIAAFCGVGLWLDSHFGTKPLWTAIFTTVGAIASLTYFIVTVLRLSRKTETKRP